MSDWSGTYLAGTITIAQIRAAINIPETKELSDVAITSAILRANNYIAVLQARYAADAEYFPPCNLAYAIYLAYQTYADRVLNVPPGGYQEGQWTPLQEEIMRDTSAKLAGLRTTYEDYEKIIKSFPVRPYGSFLSNSPSTAKFSMDQFSYPSQQYY